MIKLLALLAVMLVAALIPLGAEGRNLSGNWETQVMGARVMVHVDQVGQAISGVAYVYSPLGRKNTYHFQGSIKGRQVQAAHYSGHRFTGNIRDDGAVAGVLRTKRGHRIPVSARPK